MGKWKNGYKTLANIGLFAGTDFQPGTVQPQWNWVHDDRSGMQRRWALEATYGDPYIGGVPASGIEIEYDDLYNMLNGTSQELFALRFGTEATSEVLVVYGRRGNESSWWPAGGCTIFHVTLEMYARLYSDPNTYSESLVGYADCDVFKPLTGNISASHSHLEFFRYNNTWMVGLSNFATGGSNLYSSYFLWNPVESDFVAQFGQNEPEKTKPKSDEFGPAAEPGGGYNEELPSSGKGTFDDSSDIITPSSKPVLTPLSSNLVHAYKVNTQMLNDIADAIYVDLANDWSSVETALEAIYNAIFAAKYVDYLLDLLILPINVPAPNLVNVKVGGKYLTLSTGRIQAYLVTDPYVDFDCGSITIPEYWANFLDYTGTKVKLFLPYIGYVDIQPEYIIGGELNVKYRFNVLDGSFIVHVMSTSGKSELSSSMIGQYAGVAAVHVPLQASDYATKVSGLISAIGTVAAGMAAGGVGAMTGAANLSNTLMQKPGSTHANGYNASSSYLSHRCPYLIIERQTSQFSQKYPEEVGLPLNVMRTLGAMEGLTKCEAAHLDTIPCSIEGKEKISQLLAEGIIL